MTNSQLDKCIASSATLSLTSGGIMAIVRQLHIKKLLDTATVTVDTQSDCPKS